jgi:uncharacterized protein
MPPAGRGGDGRFASPGASAWSHAGQPLPFVRKTITASRQTWYPSPSLDMMDLEARPAAEVTAAAIPVERIHGAVLLTSGTDDLVWASAPMASAVESRLRSRGFTYPVVHLRYEHAGHLFFWEPYLPLTHTAVMGGTVPINAAAAGDCWPKILRFLDANLRGPTAATERRAG